MTCAYCGAYPRDRYLMPRLSRLSTVLADTTIEKMVFEPQYRVFCSEGCVREWQSLLIWWLLPEETRWIGEPHERADFEVEPSLDVRICWLDLKRWPEYVKTQYRSLYGRAGRGRLWVPPRFKLTAIEWDDQAPYADVCAASGGIVFHRNDLRRLADEPGLFTDLAMEPLAY